jgi:CRP/FNR family cyclic AMP-dependent transcriptional regulator
MANKKSKTVSAFSVENYLQSSAAARKEVEYRKRQTIFAQGDRCESVLYLKRGIVKLTVAAAVGKEAVIAMLSAGDFFAASCIAGQPMRTATALAMEPSSVLVIAKKTMIRVIHEEPEFSDRFVAHMLKRNVRFAEDLTDQLFNSSEKRLARTLLLGARYGKEEEPEKLVAKISQETRAEMIATTRSRVSFFMNRFRKLGYIKYNGGMQINNSLLRVVLRDR